MSKWTFGIITSDGQRDRVHQVIDSILAQRIPDCHIVVVGGKQIYLHGVSWLPFDESAKEAWITRKKNMITQVAQYENICYLHDYVALSPGWYEGFEQYGYNWNSCMTRIVNQNGQRFRDWCMIDNDGWPSEDVAEDLADFDVPCSGPRLIDYTHPGVPRWQYFSGAYFCAKRATMLRVPLDENKCWAQGEDVEWSRRMYLEFEHAAFSLNTLSQVQFLKPKQSAPWEALEPYNGTSSFI